MWDTETVHYCIVCKKKHSDWVYRWTEIKVDKKKAYYCHMGIQCDGCQKLHYNDTGGSRVTWDKGVRREVCRRWFTSSPPSIQRKMEDLSPQEVLSGVQYGLPEQKIFRKEDANTDWGKKHSEAVKELREEL